MLIACDRFHTHVALLAERLHEVELTDEDAGRIEEAIGRVFTTVALAGSLTIGLQREASDAACPHYNVLTDAETNMIGSRPYLGRTRLTAGRVLAAVDGAGPTEGKASSPTGARARPPRAPRPTGRRRGPGRSGWPRP
ncbi:hypothetical protein [Nonomuraea recticatena]|uniref:Uncharacterized protein n=1 Tax=Nonomuraea recticatena TaxID=46178 RepID=A0ABP6FWW3_9ACTN